MFSSSASSKAGRERFKLSRSKRLKRALVLKAIRKTKDAVTPKRQELGPPSGFQPLPTAA